MDRSALVVGSMGIVGHSLAEHLLAKGWTVCGSARRPHGDIRGLASVAADLLDPDGLRLALESVRPSHVFFATWSRHATKAEYTPPSAARPASRSYFPATRCNGMV